MLFITTVFTFVYCTIQEYEVGLKQIDIERMRAEQEERRKTMAEEAKHHQQVK